METLRFCSQSVNEGDPDKMCDQISDAVLDACLEQDPESKVDCLTCTKTNTVTISGKITTEATLNYEKIIRDTCRAIGFISDDVGLDADKCEVLVNIEQQSRDVFSHVLATKLQAKLTEVCKNGICARLRPVGKIQVTVEYHKNAGVMVPLRVHTVLISTQHDENVPDNDIVTDLKEHVIEAVIPKKYIDENTVFHLNTPGRFMVSGPHGDAGLTNSIDSYEEIESEFIRSIGFSSHDVDAIHLTEQKFPNIAQDLHVLSGYATDKTLELMPLTHVLATKLGAKLSEVRKNGTYAWLRPDGWTQVSVDYNSDAGAMVPLRVHTIVIETQYDETVTDDEISAGLRKYVIKPVIPDKYLDEKTIFCLNQSVRFVVGGPQRKSGLTGHKIVMDTYGGWVPHGTVPFFGKDPTKVGRSGAYMLRQAAKSIIANGLARRCLVQAGYANGVPDPSSMFVDTYETGKIADNEILQIVKKTFDFRPQMTSINLDLTRGGNRRYQKTSIFGHFGRDDSDFTWEVTKPLKWNKRQDGSPRKVVPVDEESTYPLPAELDDDTGVLPIRKMYQLSKIKFECPKDYRINDKARCCDKLIKFTQSGLEKIRASNFDRVFQSGPCTEERWNVFLSGLVLSEEFLYLFNFVKVSPLTYETDQASSMEKFINLFSKVWFDSGLFNHVFFGAMLENGSFDGMHNIIRFYHLQDNDMYLLTPCQISYTAAKQPFLINTV